MNSRLKILRKTLKLTQTEFGERLGVKGNTITGYENGTRTPSDAIIKAICREFGVREEWFRTGEEPMYMQMTPNQERAAFLASVTAGEASPEINAFIDALKSISDSDLKIVMAFVSRTYEAYKENLKNSKSPEAE